MAKQHFLCTYSVKTREQNTLAEQKQAVLEITGSTTKEKRESAEELMRTKMREIVDEHKAYRNLDVHCAFIVDGLGEKISFTF